jgi:CopG family transcriptional regulator, nickel-responsive regulator
MIDVVSRFTASLPPALLDRLDRMVRARKLPSRSHALAEMIRQHLVEHDRAISGRVVAGTVTLVYGGKTNLRNQLARIQLKYLKEVISSQHVFLEDQHSLEVLLVQGPGEKLNLLADELRRLKGVELVKMALTATVLPPLH